MSFSWASSNRISSSSCSGSGILPNPMSPQASQPEAGVTTSQPNFLSLLRFSCVTGFSYMAVFIAGARTFLQRQARTVVVSMSSAMPLASLAATLAVAGATTTRSARLARAMCSVLYWKLRSKVSTGTLLLVRVSKVMGDMNSVALGVMRTCTSQCCFTNKDARVAALYAAMLPVTPKSTVFPLSISLFPLLFIHVPVSNSH